MEREYIGAIRDEDSWSLCDKHDRIYEAEDVIFVDSIEALVIELDAMHPAPEGFTRIRHNSWSADVHDKLHTTADNEMSLVELLEAAKEHGVIWVKADDSDRVKKLKSFTNEHKEFAITQRYEEIVIEHSPRKAGARRQGKKRREQNRRRRGEVPVNDLSDYVYSLWKALKERTVFGKWIKWVDVGGKCREDWMDQVVIFTGALNTLTGKKGEHRKIKYYDAFLEICKTYRGALRKKISGDKYSMKEDRRKEVRKKFRAWIKEELSLQERVRTRKRVA